MSQPADAASPSKHRMPSAAGAQPQGGGNTPAAALPGENLLLPQLLHPHRSWVAISSWIALCCGGAGGALSGDGEPLPWQLPAARCPHRVPSGGQPALLPYRSGPSPPRQLLPIPAPSWTHFSPCCAWRGNLRQYPHPRDAPHP